MSKASGARSPDVRTRCCFKAVICRRISAGARDWGMARYSSMLDRCVDAVTSKVDRVLTRKIRNAVLRCMPAIIGWFMRKYVPLKHSSVLGHLVGISETGRARFKSDVTFPITRFYVQVGSFQQARSFPRQNWPDLMKRSDDGPDASEKTFSCR